MNTRQEYYNELKKDLFNPQMIEKAPSGFTEKVMARVSLEAKPFKLHEKLLSRIKVQAISIAVFLILTGTVLLLPAGSSDVTGMPFIRIIKNLHLPVINIDLDRLFNFSVPGYLPYLFISFLFLTIFDRGLRGLFHRRK